MNHQSDEQHQKSDSDQDKDGQEVSPKSRTGQFNHPSMLNKTAKELAESGIFPEDWSLIPVAGKDTYVKGWESKPLKLADALAQYQTRTAYQGLGVVTGSFSGGLIALDIDGFEADKVFKEKVAKDLYEAPGKETTMSWTSGKPGRRQLLWRVPEYLIKQLSHVTVIKANFLGNWVAARTNIRRKDAEAVNAQAKDALSEDLTLRFNRCQSVLPGSIHPDTKKRYKFLNYNDGVVADAPPYILDVLTRFAKAAEWLEEDDLRAIQSETAPTLVPPKQIRGWFFNSEDVQRALMPRLEELVFNHPVFEEYGWIDRDGHPPQRLSGCPWHQSTSGDAFQYRIDNGVWHCKACHVGGDVLDFIHKIETNDKYADRPIGAELERYVQPIAKELGFNYPECATASVKTVAVPQEVLSEEEFHEKLAEIEEKTRNPALRMGEMAALAMRTGRRLTGIQCQDALDEYLYYKHTNSINDSKKWNDVDAMTYLIPNLMMRPSQVLLHAAPGVGKTSAAMGLACAIGKGKSMKIRGISYEIEPGPVLWIQNDQSTSKLIRDCQDNGIDPDKDTWFVVKTGFQLNHKRELFDWIKKYKPKLVVVDSIGSCSTRMQVQEKDKAFASPFYQIGEVNGDLERGFPATTFIWIHHDNASGEARGTRYLPAAIDEQWHLRKLLDTEIDQVRNQGMKPGYCRFIQIKKSRLGREGDRIVVERDVDYAYNVYDYTPTERLEDEGTG